MVCWLQIVILGLVSLLSPMDCKAITQESTSHKKCCITEDDPAVPLSFEQIVRKQAKKGISSVIDAGADLSELEEQFSKEQKSLKIHLKKAQEMAAEVRKKIKGALADTTRILKEAMKKANGKLAAATAAAKKLGDVEEEVGSSQTKEKAIEVRAKIKKHDTKATKLDKDVLSGNGIIATLDAARILAQSTAERKQIATEQKSKKLLQDAKAIEVAMTTAEKQLDQETNAELKDETVAKQKIKQALEHNKKAVKDASEFLKNIQDSIAKFQNDVQTLYA